jgi:hypothetical protein
VIIEFIGRFLRIYVIGCVSMVAFATLLFSGCANGGVGQRAGANFIVSAPDQGQDSFGTSEAAENSAWVDWSKPAENQPGHTEPMYGGRASEP